MRSLAEIGAVLLTCTSLSALRSALGQYTLPKRTVFVVDVDDTLITPVSQSFRSQNAPNVPPALNVIDGLKRQAHHHAHFPAILSAWRTQRRVMPVDAQWPQLLQTWQAGGYGVYALTQMESGAFGTIASMEEWRYQELAQMGFVFSPQWPLLPEGSARAQHAPEHLPEKLLSGAAFYRGIMFTGPHTKSVVFGAYMAHSRSLASLRGLVYVDDKLSHVHDMQSWADAHGIAFLGVHFTAASFLPGEPDPQVMRLQSSYLVEKQVWLEDEQARALLHVQKELRQ